MYLAEWQSIKPEDINIKKKINANWLSHTHWDKEWEMGEREN